MRYLITRAPKHVAPGTIAASPLRLQATNRQAADAYFENQVTHCKPGDEVELIDTAPRNGDGTAKQLKYHYAPTPVEQSRRMWDRFWWHIESELDSATARMLKLSEGLEASARNVMTDPTETLRWHAEAAIESAARALVLRQMRELAEEPTVTLQSLLTYLQERLAGKAKYPVRSSTITPLLWSFELEALAREVETVQQYIAFEAEV